LTIKHAPALTGLRGVAVLLVMWYHAAFTSKVALPGSFFGVDVFFVLSAFLITALLVAEWHATQHIRLKAFYIRRVLRLVPALLGMLGLVTLLRVVFGPVGERLWAHVLSTLLYVNNWYQVIYPNEPANYVDHTWTLAIEEHFYLVWPVVLLLCLRRGVAPARLAYWTAGVAVLVLAVRWGLHTAHPGDPREGFKRYHYNTFARVDQLMIGATLGLLPAVWWRRLARFGLLGAGGLAAAAWFGKLRAPFVHEWGLTAVALTAVLLVAAAAAEVGFVARVLAWRPLVGVGRISYGLYLYQAPIILVLFTHDLSAPVRFVLGMTIPTVVALASWHWLEQPALRLKQRFEPARALS
jgi:peptidoglycan/LPS O-acetylase OafA/YrhL